MWEAGGGRGVPSVAVADSLSATGRGYRNGSRVETRSFRCRLNVTPGGSERIFGPAASGALVPVVSLAFAAYAAVILRKLPERS